MAHAPRPQTVRELRAAGWISASVKEEIRRNLIRALEHGEELFPGIVGYDDTVIPEIVVAVLAGHDVLFLGEKGQAKSRLMRGLVRFLDDAIPYLDVPGCAVHEDPYRPITRLGRDLLAERGDDAPIAWWPREQRYAERLAPGTKFADVIGEIDPAKLAAGASLSMEEALHFGLIPRMHRGVFAMNEVPELDELVQVGKRHRHVVRYIAPVAAGQTGRHGSPREQVVEPDQPLPARRVHPRRRPQAGG